MTRCSGGSSIVRASAGSHPAGPLRAMACRGRGGAKTHPPFDDVKETGNGDREAGHAALDTCTESTSAYVDFSGRLQRARIDGQPG